MADSSAVTFAAPTLGVMEVSITTRCPNFGAEHVEPCPSCYSLAVTSVRIPYRPPVRRLEVTTRTGEET